VSSTDRILIAKLELQAKDLVEVERVLIKDFDVKHPLFEVLSLHEGDAWRQAVLDLEVKPIGLAWGVLESRKAISLESRPFRVPCQAVSYPDLRPSYVSLRAKRQQSAAATMCICSVSARKNGVVMSVVTWYSCATMQPVDDAVARNSRRTLEVELAISVGLENDAVMSERQARTDVACAL